ncbi:ureidoglycolate dehydrogenase [Bacillus sp. M6-12]|uniref:ureidoglycolate dehydrogenase n=1 Tax=Bacillus sp. M6-12 TaxID=2054166 RepID=UPI000C75E85B|nr:ureidoglycolate dehydrogenase [Bacillus sp. M6-12]PLS18642.1 ureidoglycolate dehydrogenase [Bacillus sp. M6-12]
MGDRIVSHQFLRKLVIKKLSAVNVREEEANTVADVLVHANLRGVDSHGVLRTEHYVKRIKEGGLNTRSSHSIEQTGPSTAMYDGDNGFGHDVSKKAMEHAITLAQKTGIGAVGVKRSSHCGALSYFVKQAADEHLIGIAMTHTDTIVVPFGAAEPYFGTNPIAFGFPAKQEKPIILDLATSNAAFGKILNAKEYGKTIPEDWGVDQEGIPTTDPDKVAYLLPFGGAKGYGFSMVVDIFSGLLTGSAFGPHIAKMYDDYNKMRELGHFFMVIDPAKFTLAESFLSNMDRMIQEIHALKPANGFTRVLVPGEPESLSEEKRLNNGIPIPESVWQFLSNG